MSLSFHIIEQQNPAVADLLRLCAFLAPDAIPEEIVKKGMHASDLLLASAQVTDLFNRAIEALLAYSLIARDPNTQTLIIHRLVQAVLHDTLSPHIQRHWMQIAISAVEDVYPDSDTANWPILERMLPHALTCTTWIKQESFITPEATRLLSITGDYLHERAQYQEAEPLFRRLLMIRKQQGEPDNIVTALNDLGGLYESQGSYNEAEPLFQQALALCNQEWGTWHLNTARSLNCLAHTTPAAPPPQALLSLWRQASWRRSR